MGKYVNKKDKDNRIMNGKYRGSSNGSDAYKANAKKRTYCDYNKATSNDISYYNNSPLYSTAARFPWDKIAGRQFKFGRVNDANSFNKPRVYLPGIAQIDFVPTVGWAAGVDDPVNVAFQNIMSRFYAKYSSATAIPFQRSDMAMMLTSMASILDGIAYVQRALNLRDYWVSKNVNYPRAVISAMGLLYDDVVINAPNYISRLNFIIEQVNQMALPNFLPMFKRQFTLCNNIYLDEDSDMAQMYFFRPTGYYEFKRPDDAPTYCEFKRWSFMSSNTPLSTVLDEIQDAITTWRIQDDFYNMTGVMLKSYPETEIIHLDTVALSDEVNILHDSVIMSQIMNIVMQPNVRHLDITQDPLTGNLICKPTAYANAGQPWTLKEPIIRAYMYEPTQDDNMEMTRLVALPGDKYDDEDRNESEFYLNNCGPEIVTQFSTITYDAVADTINAHTWSYGNLVNIQLQDGAIALVMLDAILRMSNFRYCPTVIMYLANDVDAISPPYVITSDIYNYTTLPYEIYDLTQRAALDSLYKVKLPEIKYS